VKRKTCFTAQAYLTNNFTCGISKKVPPPRLELGICHLAGGRDLQFTTGATLTNPIIIAGIKGSAESLAARHFPLFFYLCPRAARQRFIAAAL